jgi:hypothetical protein
MAPSTTDKFFWLSNGHFSVIFDIFTHFRLEILRLKKSKWKIFRPIL